MKEENDVETPTERAIDVEVSGSRSDMEGSQQLLNKSDDVQPSSRRPHVASLQEESPLESLCQPEKVCAFSACCGSKQVSKPSASYYVIY